MKPIEERSARAVKADGDIQSILGSTSEQRNIWLRMDSTASGIGSMTVSNFFRRVLINRRKDGFLGASSRAWLDSYKK